MNAESLKQQLVSNIAAFGIALAINKYNGLVANQATINMTLASGNS